jgi:hypothetical protein
VYKEDYFTIQDFIEIEISLGVYSGSVGKSVCWFRVSDCSFIGE